MPFELSLEVRTNGAWESERLAPTPDSVSAAMDKLAFGVVGTLKLNSGAEELWVSGGPELFNVLAVTGPDHFFDLIGDRDARGSRELVVGGQTSEVPARHCVTRERALQALWGFLASGHIAVSDEQWERQGSEAPD